MGAHIEKNGSREIWIFILGDGSIGQIGDFGRWEHPVKKKVGAGRFGEKKWEIGRFRPPHRGPHSEVGWERFDHQTST